MSASLLAAAAMQQSSSSRVGTIGYDTIGSQTAASTSGQNAECNVASSTRYTAGTGESVTKVWAYGADTGDVHVGLYTWDGSAPKVHIAQATISIGASAGWYSADVDWPLMAGTDYVVAIDWYTDQAVTTYYDDTAAGDMSFETATSLPDPSWTESFTGAYLDSIYAEVWDGRAFDPQFDLPWYSLYWAEGIEFDAEGYSDGNTLTSWVDEIANRDLTTVESTPTYDASVPNLNNQPAVNFDGGASSPDAVEVGGHSPSYTSGVTIVIIAHIDSLTTTRTLVDNYLGTNRNSVYLTATTWGIYAGGTARTGGTSSTGDHLFVAHFDGSTGNDWLEVDGTSVISGSDAGSGQLAGFKIAARNDAANGVDGQFAFVGIYEGDATADSKWGTFVTWAENHYGLTVA